MSTLLTNLTAYWKLEDLTDASGSSNTLTNNNSVTFTAGKISNAATFTAASSMSLSIANGSQTGLNLTGDFSLNCWIKTTAQSNGNDYYIASRLTGGAGFQWLISWAGGNQLQSFTVNGTNHASTTNMSLSNGTYFMLTVVFNSSTGVASFYKNGSALDTQSGYTAATTNTATFNIGVSATGTSFWNGQVDEMGVWSRQLTTGEISALYSLGNAITYPLGVITLAETEGSTDVVSIFHALNILETQSSTDTNKIKSGWADLAKDTSTWTNQVKN